METAQAEGAAMISGPHVAKKLSRFQIDYLVDHVDGNRPVTLNRMDIGTRRSLIERGLIQFDQGAHITKRGTSTILTNFGRDVLCAVFADWADALTRWEYGYGRIDRNIAGNRDPGDGKFTHQIQGGPNERCGIRDVPSSMRLSGSPDQQALNQRDHHGVDAGKP